MSEQLRIRCAVIDWGKVIDTVFYREQAQFGITRNKDSKYHTIFNEADLEYHYHDFMDNSIPYMNFLNEGHEYYKNRIFVEVRRGDTWERFPVIHTSHGVQSLRSIITDMKTV